MKLYVSGYGGGAIPSIGIFNIDNDQVPEKYWVDYVESSSYLSIYGDYIFGISELEGNSYVHMFKKSQEGYSHIDKKIIKGAGLCHITYLPKNRVLAGACYESGEIFTVRTGENSFGDIVSFIKQGENKDTITRAHCVVPNKSETMLYSANIALDMIYSYKIIQGELFENDQLMLPKGEGPRHILLSPGEDRLYVITEYSNKIFIINSAEERMSLVDSVSILPENFCGDSYGSSICMTTNGKFMYGANRGANTIAVFHVFKDGKIKKIDDFPCFGDWPRHISLVDNDGYLAIANQNSNQVVLCKLDSTTGLLTKEIINIDFNNVSYVK